MKQAKKCGWIPDIVRSWCRAGPRICCRAITLEQLEERIVLDAAVVNADTPHVDQHSPVDTSIKHADLNGATNPDAHARDSGNTCDTSEPTKTSTVAPSLDPADPSKTSPQADTLTTRDSPATSGNGVKVLVVSDSASASKQLIDAARAGVVTVAVADRSDVTPASILSQIEIAVDGKKIDSIGFAAHGSGDGTVLLTKDISLNFREIATSSDLRAFWEGVGKLLSDDGRIDLLTCGLASSFNGSLLVSQIQDLAGHEVSASDDATGNPAQGGDWILERGARDAAATYFVPGKIDDYTETLYIKSYKLLPTLPKPGDQFGYGVSIYGDIAVVSGMEQGAGGLGSAYVFQFDGTDWVEIQQLTFSRPIRELGVANATDGRTVVVSDFYADYDIVPPIVEANGYVGNAFVFGLDGGSWKEQQVLWGYDGKGAIEDQVQRWEQFSRSVAVSGDMIFVGALGDHYTYDPRGPVPGDQYWAAPGAVYVYGKDTGGPNNWGFLQRIEASDRKPGDWFGYSVAVSGDTMIVGAKFRENPVTLPITESYPQDGFGRGSAYVFKLESGIWVEKDILQPADLAPYVASPYKENDCFGQSVSLDGNTAIISADFQNVGGQKDVGAAYIYSIDSSGKGTLVQKLIPSDGAGGDRFGRTVSIVGDYTVVGAYKADPGGLSNSGAAYVFKVDPAGVWTEVEKLTAPDAQAGDRLGNTLSLYGDAAHGTYVIVGAPYESNSKPGKAHIFVLAEPTTSGGSGSVVDAAHGEAVLPRLPLSAMWDGTRYVGEGFPINTDEAHSDNREPLQDGTEQVGLLGNHKAPDFGSDRYTSSDLRPFFGRDMSEIPVSFAEGTQATAVINLDGRSEPEHRGAEEEPISFCGFLEEWKPGKFIVFNFDELKIAEAMEDSASEPAGSSVEARPALTRVYDPEHLDWSAFLEPGSPV
ncbi:MAG: DUF4347 domain-containing protein [Thermodesulfobacteriota bacterium]